MPQGGAETLKTGNSLHPPVGKRFRRTRVGRSGVRHLAQKVRLNRRTDPANRYERGRPISSESTVTLRVSVRRDRSRLIRRGFGQSDRSIGTKRNQHYLLSRVPFAALPVA